MTPESTRATELLVDRATEGLDPGAESELRSLGLDATGFDTESFELAAAAIDLTHGPQDTELPDGLYRRLSLQARAWDEATSTWDQRRAEVARFPAPPPTPDPVSTSSSPWVGWAAAAACLALAVAGWWPSQESRSQGPLIAENPSPQIAPAPATPTLASLRQELLTEARDLQQLGWTSTDDPAAATEVTGDLIWSTAQQAGFMRISGLAVNDPTVEQYQLWIFDPTQDERYPIDGGVFDVTSRGEVIIPIDARLPVTGPTLFAITIEKPGGVVVSSRERLPLLAKAV